MLRPYKAERSSEFTVQLQSGWLTIITSPLHVFFSKCSL